MCTRFRRHRWQSPLGWLLLLSLLTLALVEQRTDVIQPDVGLYPAINSAPHGFTSTTLAQAIIDLGTTPRRLLLTRGAWSLTTDHTIPATTPLVIPEGTTV